MDVFTQYQNMCYNIAGVFFAAAAILIYATLTRGGGSE